MALEDFNPFDLSGTNSALQPTLTPSVPILMAQAQDPGVQIASANPTEDEMRAYVKQAAIARGIDPNIAQTVISHEGGWSDPFQHGKGPAPKSQDPSLGKLENSYGPLQLYISGTGAGLGDKALAAGIDPRKDWKAGVNFALDHASQNGWDEWYGAKAAGITGKMGIHGAGAPATASGPAGPILASTRHQAPTDAEAAATDASQNQPMADANAAPDGRAQLMKLMLAASLANIRLQPVDYDPYKVMPHMQY